MRKLIIIILTLQAANLFSQKLSKGFNGQIIYNKYDYYKSIKLDSCVEFKSQRILVKFKSYFEIIDSLDNYLRMYRFLPTRFAINNKNHWINMMYIDPRFIGWTNIAQFPLNKGDTIYGAESYLNSLDSIFDLNALNGETLFNKIELSSDIKEPITNTGDTNLVVLGHNYKCYKFEMFDYYPHSKPGPSKHRHVIYLDKNSLLPIQEEWFSWYKEHPCIPEKQWTLNKKIIISEINNSN